MNIHLLNDALCEYRDKKTIPIHFFIKYQHIPKEPIHDIYYQNVKYDSGIKYDDWKKISYHKMSSEIKLSTYFKDLKTDLCPGIIFSVDFNLDDYTDSYYLFIKFDYGNYEYREMYFTWRNIMNTRPKVQKIVENQQVEKFFDLSMDFISDTTIDHAQQNLNSGPLEPPSTIRGYKLQLNDKTPPLPDTDETNKKINKSKSELWYSQNIQIENVRCRDKIYEICVMWYELSFYKDTIIEQKKLPMSVSLNVINFITKPRYYLIDLSKRVFDLLIDAINKKKGRINQKFLVNVRNDYSVKDITSIIFVAKGLWFLKLNMKTCIIKAIISHLSKNGKGEPLNSDRYWGDLIDCKNQIVSFGKSVQLHTDPETGLYISDVENQTPWEIYQDCSILYMNEELTLHWIIPGGFCVSTKFELNDADLEIYRWKFSHY
ncbi:DNA packaging tegument protein [Murid herpesvirus 3]|uniref:DNA packaging tegument protein n=2 Tax=Murid betaherpesvirus 3 TaxID=2560603 RepID=A0A1P8VIW2_9BETA|nr:DNA packaging tegument protein [Murine roseolovirus]APZ76293.1 DNA packaging tegument protein [Murid betaherpesvirus 3]AYH64740.1 DNA packaging tegument protein [Murid herpesvirus 3]